MEPENTFSQVSAVHFDLLLGQYANTVPEKLADLDNTRYNIIPARVKEQKNKSPSLSKDDIATLVDWKLSHGKFRPSLRGLVQQNTEELVATTTSNAFTPYTASGRSAVDVKAAINTLTKLRGIGPATASLLLSVYDDEHVPFFSDELFRWSMFEDGKGKAWDRAIKYDVKEYMELFGRVQSFRDRFRDEEGRAVSSTDIEKVAYVLGKQAKFTATSSNNTKEAGTGGKRKADSTVDTTAADSKSKTKKLAKSSLTTAEAKPTRRSTRTTK